MSTDSSRSSLATCSVTAASTVARPDAVSVTSMLRRFPGSRARVTWPASSRRSSRLVMVAGESIIARASADGVNVNGSPERRSAARTSNSPVCSPCRRNTASMAGPASPSSRPRRPNVAMASSGRSGRSTRHCWMCRSTASTTRALRRSRRRGRSRRRDPALRRGAARPGREPAGGRLPRRCAILGSSARAGRAPMPRSARRSSTCSPAGSTSPSTAGCGPDTLDNHTLRLEGDHIAEVWFHNREQAPVDAFWSSR